MGKIAFVFAGQGAQYPGMGKSLYDSIPAAKEVFDAAERLRPGTLEQCFSSDAETLADTINTQPCVFTMDLACAAALESKGVTPHAVAGFSLGELAALVYSGMLSMEEGFRLVMERARLMQACAEKYPGAMAAVLRLSSEETEAHCGNIPGVYPVNYNCPGQTVVSGSIEAVAALEKSVQEAGGRCMRLKVSGCFHTPFMRDAADGLLNYMEGMQFLRPKMPVYANATASPYGDTPKDLLAGQCMRPVLWQKTVENMLADGYDTFIEAGAGKTLSGLINKTGGAKRVLQVEDTGTLQAVMEAMGEERAC